MHHPAATEQPAPPASKGGEFTQFYNASNPVKQAGPQFPSPSQYAHPAPAPPAPAAPAESGGEYTRMFGPGALSNTPPPAAPPPPTSPAPYNPGSGATQAFRSTPNVPPPPAAQAGPSEYTMMINRGSMPAGPPAAPSASAPGGMQLGMPQMPMPQVQAPQLQVQPPQMQMQGLNMQSQGPQVNMQPPQMQAPQMPQMQMPQAPAAPQLTAAAPKASTNTLLIVIFCLLAFLAGGMVVYLLARH